MVLEVRLPLLVQGADIAGAIGRGLQTGAQIRDIGRAEEAFPLLQEQRQLSNQATQADIASAQGLAINQTAAAIRQLPIAQRAQAIQQAVPQLEALGVPREQIESVDFTDAGLDQLIASTAGFAQQTTGARFQKGATAVIQTPEGPAFATQILDPRTGQVQTRTSPIAGDLVSRIGETPEQRQVREIQTAGGTETARLTAEAAGRPAVVSAVGAAEAVTPLGAAELESKRIRTDETKITNAQERQEIIAAKQAAFTESTAAANQVGRLLDGDRFAAAFGKVINTLPERLRPQAAIDARAEIDQILGLLSLESRQKLKGQGTITDSEAKTLERSATVLSNPLISDKLARQELRRVRNIFERAADAAQLSKQTREGFLVPPTAPAADTGDILQFDAQGNLIQ